MSTEFVNAISSLPILAGRSICDQSGYAIDSAYQKVSAMSSYALSAGVSGVIDTVSSNSASWGNGGVVSSVNTGTYGGITCVDQINSYKLFAMYADSATTAGYAVNDDAGNLIRTAYAKASSLEDKADSSALSSYALSANVSGCIDTVSSNSASWGAGASLPITGSAGTDSATYGETSVEFNRYDTAGEPDIRTASLSPDALDITYTVDENDYYSVHITDSVIEFSDPDGYYDITPYDITNWNSAAETVANNSASWGGGGAQVVTATGSASATSVTAGHPPIATSYLVSSINGSALLPYGYSSLSSNSANWNSTRNVVTANSANWNSAYSLISGVTALMDAI